MPRRASSSEKSATLREKRDALQGLLRSRALARSEQLRAFLRYVCEADFEGKAQALNEYAIGVHALGRPKDYSPAEDACVRSRAYELRSKLTSYYEQEAPDAALRIEIPKGSYAPRFVRPTPAPASARPAASADALASRELTALWRPFLDSKAPLLIVFDVRLFFFAPGTELVVRHYLMNDPAEVASSAPLAAFSERMQAAELQERRDYADFGTVHAAFAFGRLLAGRNEVGLKHSHRLDWHDIWNSNIVFVGKASVSPIVCSLLKDLPFFDGGTSITNLQPAPGEPSDFPSAVTHGLGQKHALITRMPSPQSGLHMLLLTGSSAEMMWALSEAVTNPHYTKELMPHLEVTPGEYAEAFQVVIRAEFQSNVPVRITRAAHRVLSLEK
jgi:hypothetical protein